MSAGKVGTDLSLVDHAHPNGDQDC